MQADDDGARSRDEREVLAVVRAWAEAIVTNDADRIAECVAEEWVFVDAAGVSPGSRFLALVRSGELTHSAMADVEPPRVRVHGDTAVVTARVTNTARFGGEDVEADEWTTDVFVRREGRWRCVLTHLTPAESRSTEPLGVPPQPARMVAADVVLRGFRDDDVAMAMDLATDPYVAPTGTLPAHATREQALEWLARQRRRPADGSGYSFAIADPQTDRALGQIGLWLSGLDQGRLTAGYGIAPSERGRGVATAALRLLTTFAWTLADAHRIELYIEPWNLGSVRTAERAGYRREGLLRSHQVIGGTRRDMLLFARLREDG